MIEGKSEELQFSIMVYFYLEKIINYVIFKLRTAISDYVSDVSWRFYI